jgi:hypothetical protein
MTITRDADYPAEYAQLMAAFNRTAGGYDQIAVLNASLQMLAAAIGFVTKQNNSTREKAEAYANHLATLLVESVMVNWDRKPEPGDIAVRPQ